MFYILDDIGNHQLAENYDQYLDFMQKPIQYIDHVENYRIVTEFKGAMVNNTLWETTITILGSLISQEHHSLDKYEAWSKHFQIVKNVTKRCRLCGYNKVIPHPTKGWLCSTHINVSDELPRIRCQRCNDPLATYDNEGWICERCLSSKQCACKKSENVFWNNTFKKWECNSCLI